MHAVQEKILASVAEYAKRFVLHTILSGKAETRFGCTAVSASLPVIMLHAGNSVQ